MLKNLNVYSRYLKFDSSIKIVLLLFGILLSLSGCERISAPMMLPDDSTLEAEPLTVMTYNVYVGGSTDRLLAVENLLQVPQEVANMYNNVIASDFPGRAAAIAKSIKASQPHLIGLQEISLVRRQSPGDRLTGGEPAEEVIFDFLEIMMEALQTEGLNYQVAAKVQNFDIEMPMGSFTEYDDVRLTDFDVILARSDVTVSRPVSMNYNSKLTIDDLFIEVLRGYVAIDATVSGTTYRVVNTHLEAEALGKESRVAQAQELINNLQNETLPIILLGDFNTAAPDGAAYQILLSAGYVDVWQMDSVGTGNTCCQVDDLLNEVSDLSVRIDQIFVRNLETSASVLTHTVGDTPLERLSSGLWPSDHAGVVAYLAFE